MDEPLSIAEVRRAVELVREVFEREYAGEPMPSFDSYDEGKLSGALAAPFQSAFGEDIYASVFQKAAALFYFVAKDHAFENGNKRTAVITLAYFLAKNNLALDLTSQELYELAVETVEATEDKTAVIAGVAEVLEQFIKSIRP